MKFKEAALRYSEAQSFARELWKQLGDEAAREALYENYDKAELKSLIKAYKKQRARTDKLSKQYSEAYAKMVAKK
jgi:hypothetical protein